MAMFRFYVVLLLFVLVWINPIRARKNHESISSESLEEDFLRRRFLKELLGLRERTVSNSDLSASSTTIEFTPEQRKFQEDALNTHNILRAQHCAQPLVLDDEINIRSQIFADVLASNDSRLAHSTDRMGRYGENLYAVTRSRPITNPDADKVTRTWYTEIALYDYNKPGYTPHIAHFSQIVWNSTQRLGVGYAFARQGCKMFVVMQYAPPGNYGFAFRNNVFPTTCRES